MLSDRLLQLVLESCSCEFYTLFHTKTQSENPPKKETFTMSEINRRHFMAGAALTAAALRLRALEPNHAAATLTLPTEAAGPQIPRDFLGLSYEIQQLVEPGFFSASNHGLIEAFLKLSEHGVLRLGGNTSEFGYWKPQPDSAEPEHPKTREVEGEPKAQYYAVTPEAVRNLAGFLKATGWTCLYGIGMGTNTPEHAADEAVFVAKTLGDRLQYFQIGNEADLFDRHLRDPKTWSAKAYLDEWLTLARAIVARVPDARFGIPDVAVDVTWLPKVAELWPNIANPPKVTTLSHHHYFNGPATNPDVTIENMLKPATMAKVQKTAEMASAAADKMHMRVRMTEGNTCYRGGKPGVSDVFAAALWSADYALLLAKNNYSGINLHGGTGKSVANSVGGVLPGDTMLKAEGKTEAEIQTHPHPFYTPIGTFDGHYEVQPVGWGLKFAARLSGGQMLTADLTSALQASGVNATAYAAKLADGSTSVIVLNKDLAKDVELTLDFGANKKGSAAVETMSAPSPTSRTASIAPAKPIKLHAGKALVKLAHASAIRLTVR